MLYVLECFADINLYLLLSRATEKEEGLEQRWKSGVSQSQEEKKKRNKTKEKKTSSIFMSCFNVQELICGSRVLR